MKRRVLVFSDCYIYGGSERLMMFLLGNEQVKEKYELSFAYREHEAYTQGIKGDMEKMGINVHIYPLQLMDNATRFHKINCQQIPGIIKLIKKLPYFLMEKIGIFHLYNVKKLQRFLQEVKPEMIHVNNGGYPAAASCNDLVLAADKCGISRIVYQVNNMAYPPKNEAQKKFDRKIEDSISTFLTASIRASNALHEVRGFSKNKIRQIPNTVKVEPIRMDRAAVLKEMGWDDNTFLLIHVGFLTARKGQIYLLQAVNAVRKQYPNIKVAFVGNGEDEEALKQYVQENDLSAYVFFAGYRTNPIDFINAANIFLLPSVSNEDMPLAMLEAMVMGKSIISTDLAGIVEAIKDGENGVLLPLDKQTLVADLEKAIVDLYNHPDKMRHYGEAAHITFQERFSERAYGQKMTGLYDQIFSKSE